MNLLKRIFKPTQGSKFHIGPTTSEMTEIAVRKLRRRTGRHFVRRQISNQ